MVGTASSPLSAFWVAVGVLLAASCGPQKSEGPAPGPNSPAPPVLDVATATFTPVTKLSSVAKGAGTSIDAASRVLVKPSSDTSGYQVEAALPSESVGFIVVRYETAGAAQGASIGLLAADGSKWLVSAPLGADGAPAELSIPVSAKSVRLVIESAKGVKPFAFKKLEVATFCLGGLPEPGKAPVAKQCYPKLEPTVATESASFRAATFAAVSPDGQVTPGPGGALAIKPSTTVPGYQAWADIKAAGSRAIVVRYAVDADSAPGVVGLLRGDQSGWILAKPFFGRKGGSSGTFTVVSDDAAPKLVIESPAKAGAITFKQLEYALLCETTPQRQMTPAVIGGCPVVAGPAPSAPAVP